jgi:NAD(P)-dependent dehydrogenase (short-subunit alcohol dehydrogenase family)
LVTGANRGIGLATATHLARLGYHVFLGARQLAAGEAIVRQLHEQGLTTVEAVQLDVTDVNSVAQARQALESRADHLDALINNAGILGQIPQKASLISVAEMQRVFATNLFGVVATTQALLPLLRVSPAPRIVNVTSDLASLTLHNDPSWPYYAFKSAGYGVSKTALNAYTLMLAHELLGTAFKVNMVNPGHTKTDFNNQRGTGTVEAAASLLAHFAMLPADGPTGKYYGPCGEQPW